MEWTNCQTNCQPVFFKYLTVPVSYAAKMFVGKMLIGKLPRNFMRTTLRVKDRIKRICGHIRETLLSTAAKRTQRACPPGRGSQASSFKWQTVHYTSATISTISGRNTWAYHANTKYDLWETGVILQNVSFSSWLKPWLKIFHWEGVFLPAGCGWLRNFSGTDWLVSSMCDFTLSFRTFWVHKGP